MVSPLRSRWWTVLAIVGTCVPLTVVAQDPEVRGLEIAAEADRRDSGYRDITAELTMTLRSRNGREHTRVMRIKTLEVEGDGNRTILVFDQPRDLEGTALLTLGHPTGADDQWLYLPALRRVKRIASGNQASSFMGSEFAYEDIGSQELGKYTYRFLQNDSVAGRSALAVERIPTDPKSGYARQVVWFDSEEYRVLKIDYYDRSNALLKSLELRGYRRYAEAYWRPDEMRMVNHQTGKSTTLRWRDYRFGVGLREGDFDRNRLSRVR